MLNGGGEAAEGGRGGGGEEKGKKRVFSATSTSHIQCFQRIEKKISQVQMSFPLSSRYRRKVRPPLESSS